MGELSKKIGDDGEKLIRNFLAMIGWERALENISIACMRPQKHATENQIKGRQTHGIDLLFPQKKQLEDFRAEHVIMSVKFSQKAYPKSPSSTFKGYITDLAHTIECYKNSDAHRESLRGLTDTKEVNSESFVGVLFWLTSEKSSDQDIISKISNANIPSSLKFETIQVVDNNRAQFIYNSLAAAKRIFPTDNISFNYTRYSDNFTDRNIPTHGLSMPSEFFGIR
ncbi:hypothetical protein [Rhizobium sp. BG4]|uniref:hypothetical protein n=1 Tax=Rhizobium sp. BG4 TaxID=2613770 RepID=UPI00193D88D2|nr:hypothetical protein [Rhizobium sp. BG4]QRM45213.1 hypothetical protein F2982_18325 [Rhizobium sp. BG4]